MLAFLLQIELFPFSFKGDSISLSILIWSSQKLDFPMAFMEQLAFSISFLLLFHRCLHHLVRW